MELVEWQRNPMQLVEIKGISKRQKKPVVLTVEQYCHLLELLPQPYQMMVVVAQCTGLRAEEVLALEWQDIDFENLSMKVVRAVVHGRVKMVKTEYLEDELPLDPDFAAILLDWKTQCQEQTRSMNRPNPMEIPTLLGWSYSLPAPSPGGTSTRLLSSRTISVLPDAVWWSVRSAVLRDILIGEETEIEEHSGSEMMRPGDVIYAQIWILPEVATLGRSAPIPIPPDRKVEIIKLRAQLQRKIKKQNRDLMV